MQFVPFCGLETKQPKYGIPTVGLFRLEGARTNVWRGDIWRRQRVLPRLESTDVDEATKLVDMFVKDAAIGGLTEVELGKLALQKSSDTDVKQFAQLMIDDHTKANDQLKQAATQDKIDVPSSVDSKHQAVIDKLSALSGTQFDKAYIKNQLKDHETDVREFNAEAQNGSDPNVKAFASSTLPTLQQHLSHVKTLSKSETKQTKASS